MSKSAYLLRLLLLLAMAAPAVAQQELTIASAADLQSVMDEIAMRWTKSTSVDVKVSFGSSGNFFSQIENGAPFDLFFSADIDYPMKLEAAGLIARGSLFQYAIGKIVLWVPKGSALDVSRGLNAVADPSVKKLAIANPAHAPYGRAAQAALRKAGLWEQVSPKLVLGENISQTAQFVQSGNADAGILALSVVLAPGMKDQGRYFELPQDLYPSLRQAGVILRRSQHKELAARFMDFLKTDEIKSLLEQYGFSTDGEHR